MALPNRKTSKARKRQRRAHDALSAPGLSTCAQCKQSKLPHRVCPHCGFYRGRKVLDTKAEKEKS